MISSTTGIFDDGTVVPITTTVPEGQIFAGWIGEGIADPASISTTVLMTGHRQVEASFDRIRYMLTINIEPEGGGTVTGGGMVSGTIPASLVATANPGYISTGWTGAEIRNPNSSRIAVNVNENMAITANFERILHTLTINSHPLDGGIVTGAGTYGEGTEVPITATANSGYRFTGWTGTGVANPSSANTTVSMAENRTITANFERVSYNLTVNRSIAAGGTVTGSGTFNVGAVVAITATASPGYTFIGWTGAGVANPSSANTTVSMTADRMVVAVFQNTGTSGNTFTDPRDGKIYRTVEIGNLRWMAENLNYAPVDSSWCFGTNDSTCAIYGRLYGWEAAMSVCPAGWRLPDKNDWEDLMRSVGGIPYSSMSGGAYWNGAAGKLKSRSPDWNGTDDFGFSALPGGFRVTGSCASRDCPPDSRVSENYHISYGASGHWWSATTDTEFENYVYIVEMYGGHGDAYLRSNDINQRGYSVRCVQGQR
jgi:uncharacterized protein (TIGR02145 family)/uncharacterized repeat protein (TIGR02543 family)